MVENQFELHSAHVAMGWLDEITGTGAVTAITVSRGQLVAILIGPQSRYISDHPDLDHKSVMITHQAL